MMKKKPKTDLDAEARVAHKQLTLALEGRAEAAADHFAAFRELLAVLKSRRQAKAEAKSQT